MNKRCLLVFVILFGVIGCEKTTAPIEKHPGEAIYDRYCRSCHHAGVADSPKFGDVDAWQPLIEKGREALLQSSLNGIAPGMPVKGLCMSCTDLDLANAIDFMVLAAEQGSQSQD